ncbi:MAG: hypothetical protein ACLR5S_08535 [Ruminococcus sp.]
MLILNFCVHGRCDASLAQNRYAIVKENQVCLSTILPTKDFYYPGRLYEGIQFYLDLDILHQENGQDFLSQMGVPPEQTAAMFCEKNGIYLHRMNDALLALVREAWAGKDEPELGMLVVFHGTSPARTAVYAHRKRNGYLFHTVTNCNCQDAEALILSDLSKRITAKELADDSASVKEFQVLRKRNPR